MSKKSRRSNAHIFFVDDEASDLYCPTDRSFNGSAVVPQLNEDDVQERDERPVLVLGGTGHLGADIVSSLLRQGRRVRVLSRTPGSDPRVQWVPGDLTTGDGLAVAFSRVSHVIHAATNSPIAQRGGVRLTDLWRSPDDVDVRGTQMALDAAQRQGAKHFLFVSIVGLEHSKLPYSRVKLAGEDLVRASPLPWSVLRATPFFYLVERMLGRLHRLPLWCLPDAPFQPVDTRDVAEHLIQILDAPARGVMPPIGGPEITSYADMARAHLLARGVHRRVLGFPLPHRWARQSGLVVVEDGVQGIRTWQDWLTEQTAGMG